MEILEIPVGPLVFPARAAGPEDGRAVLLLHGFPETSWSWRHQLEALGGAGYRAVAFDQRGYAPTARPVGAEHYAMAHLVADVLAVADGCIVGSSLKVDGNTWNPVDPERAAEFMRIVRQARKD